MKTFTADWILSPNGLKKGLFLEVSDAGKIISLSSGAPKGEAEHHEGILCPGFINTHCHLELSYLKGQIPEHTGMAGFVQKLQKIRNDFTEEDRQEGIKGAIEEMKKKGIVAIGDICNGESTVRLKVENQSIQYRNFIELFGLRAEKAEEILESGQALAARFSHASLSPHAPYSLSPQLLDLIYEAIKEDPQPVSVHFLESAQERQLFEEKSGPFLDFFSSIGLGPLLPEADSPLDFLFPKTDSSSSFQAGYPLRQASMLLVHNTEVRPEELQQLLAKPHSFYFCLCPLANQYIHDTLPPALLFAKTAADRITIGTDSLAGNHQLSILAELQCLQSHFPELSTSLLLQWATINGAKALAFDQELGSFDPGKRPGILHLSNIEKENANLRPETQVNRLF